MTDVKDAEYFYNCDINELTANVIGSAIEVHNALGPGLLERVYHESLQFELESRGIPVASELSQQVVYKGIKFEKAYRIDLLVANRLVVEVKAKDALIDKDIAQTLTYLKLGRFKLGLLINFHEKKLLKGVKRVILS